MFGYYYVALKIVTYVLSYIRYLLLYMYLNSFGPIWSSFKTICNIFRIFWAHLASFRPILAFGSFRLIWTGLSSFRFISAHLGSFEFILDSFQPIKLSTFYLLAPRAVISLQFTEKNQTYQYLFYVYHLVFSSFDDNVRYFNVNFEFRSFSAYCSRPPLNKADLILAT